MQGACMQMNIIAPGAHACIAAILGQAAQETPCSLQNYNSPKFHTLNVDIILIHPSLQSCVIQNDGYNLLKTHAS